MELIEIQNSPESQALLQLFIDRLGEAKEKFRYFNQRELGVIQNHLVTILVMDGQEPVGYGHLDPEAGRIWLGISLIPSFQGKGLGSQIMKALLAKAKLLKIEQIALAVDKTNFPAQKLYEKFDFVRVEEKPRFYLYELPLHS